MPIFIVITFITLAVSPFAFFYISPPLKYKKANRLLVEHKYREAITIFKKIYYQVPDAPVYLAVSLFYLGKNGNLKREESIKLFKQVLKIKNDLTEIANKKIYQQYEVKAGYELVNLELQFCADINDFEIDNKILKFEEINELIVKLNQTGLEKEFQKLHETCNHGLSDSYFKKGIAYEKRNSYKKAILEYKTAKQNLSHNNHQDLSKIEIRIGICKLKMGQLPEGIYDDLVKQAPPKYRRDYYYRLAIGYLKLENYSKAKQIISEYLPNSNRHVKKLIRYIEYTKKEKALQAINQLNYGIQKLNDSNFQIEKFRDFYQLEERIINNIFKIVSSNLQDELKKNHLSILKSILTYDYQNEEYVDAFNLLSTYPSFWNYSDLLSNIAICIYGLLKNKKIDVSNYEIILSGWLTAVFSDDVWVYLINQSNWNNNYSFTLDNSLGSIRIISKLFLFDNINFEKANDTNISIREAQDELLNKFEQDINLNIDNPELLKKILDFFKTEKQAIKNISNIIPEQAPLIAPRLAKKTGWNLYILEKLEHKYKESDNEEFLEAGIPYFNGYREGTSGLFFEYNTQSVYLNEILRLTKNLQEVEYKYIEKAIHNYTSINKNIFINLLNNFDNALYITLHKLDIKDLNSVSVDSLNNIFSKISPLPKSLKLYTRLILDYCIAKLNSNEIGNYQSLKQLAVTYEVDRNDERLCENLSIVINNNFLDILNSNPSNEDDIYYIFDDIIKNRSETFFKYAKRIENFRNDLLKEMETEGIDIQAFDNFTNMEVGNTLIIQKPSNLNYEGRKLWKALLYMKKMSSTKKIYESTLLPFGIDKSRFKNIY